MQLVYAATLGGAAWLLFLAALLSHRRPDPPKWLTESVLSDLLTVAVIGLGALSVGAAVRFAFQVSEQGVDLIELEEVAVALAIVVGVAFVHKALRVRKRLAAYAAAEAATTAAAPAGTGPALSVDGLMRFAAKETSGANDDGPGAPRQTPKGSGGRRRKRAA